MYHGGVDLKEKRKWRTVRFQGCMHVCMHACTYYLGGWKAIALGFAECLWWGRLTGHHFLGRAFIDDRRVSQESWKETFNFESPKSKIIARLFQWSLFVFWSQGSWFSTVICICSQTFELRINRRGERRGERRYSPFMINSLKMSFKFLPNFRQKIFRWWKKKWIFFPNLKFLKLDE